MSYAKPITPTPPGTATPRTLLPFSNTQSVEPPAVHFAKRDFIHGWVCSTHIVQAASPRESPAVKTSNTVTTKPLTAESTKAERQAAVDMKYAQIMEQRTAIAAGVKVAPDETPMWIAVNRYAPARVPSDSPGVTLIVAHATGFHKEIWDTTFRFIISILERNARMSDIAEIWAIDAANHGDSALLNEGKIGDIYEWSDHTRDIANFVINYLPESPTECKDSLLPLVPKSVSLQRMSNRFSSRTIIGIGHSFGGCTLMRAALHLPHLFSGVILIDPIVYPTYARREEGVGKLAKGALGRRDRWPNVNAAKSGLLNSPFFQAWHPDVFSDYMKYGLCESEGMVKLKCSGYQEGVSFAEHGRLPNEVWEMLPSFDERIPLRWLMDSRAALSTGGEEITQHTVWRRPKNSSNARIQGAGHLIPQEAPERLAHEIYDFIQQVVDSRGIKPRL